MTRLPSPALFPACAPQAALALSLLSGPRPQSRRHICARHRLDAAEPQRVRQGRVLNKGPHTNCSLESQTSSSNCWDFITR